MKQCQKCGEEFEQQKGLINFCSLSCRNSRKFKVDSINKKKESAIKNWNKGIYDFKKTGKTLPIEKICMECNKMYLCNPYRKNQKYCSIKCSSTSNERREKMSTIIKEQYNQGKEVYGGRTKWVEVKTSKGIIKVQGSYESSTCLILDRWLLEKKIKDWEYTNDRISYINSNGETSTYILDFKIYDNDGFYYLETKGRVVDNDYLKWESVRNLGHRLVVWFEHDIKKHGV
jgi:hypothetical protein